MSIKSVLKNTVIGQAADAAKDWVEPRIGLNPAERGSWGEANAANKGNQGDGNSNGNNNTTTYTGGSGGGGGGVFVQDAAAYSMYTQDRHKSLQGRTLQ